MRYFCRMPIDWTETGKLKWGKYDLFFEELYGKNWQYGMMIMIIIIIIATMHLLCLMEGLLILKVLICLDNLKRNLLT